MSFLDFFLLLLIWIPLAMLWIFALSDLARRADISSAAKGLWAVAIVLLPIIGMIIYFIVRPDDAAMAPDAAARYAEAREEAGLGTASLDQLEKLADLRDSGAISDEEFASMKAKILG